MDINLDKLNEDELMKLQAEVQAKLVDVRINQLKLQNDNILSLKNGDKIFGFRLSFGVHRLVDIEGVQGNVDIADYCVVTSNELRGEASNDFRLNISYPKGGLGIGVTLIKEEYKNNHCLLSLGVFGSGYDAFYTLKPETWKTDIIVEYDKLQQKIEKRRQKDLVIYKAKLNMFLAFNETTDDGKIK